MYTRERMTAIVPRLMGVPELMAYLSMGRNNAVKFAKEAGAVKSYGRTKLYDREKIDAACDQLASEEE